MARRMTREEKSAAFEASERTKKANEFRDRVARAKALRVWDEKQAWQGDNHNDKAVQALWTMVRDFEQCTSDLRKKLDRMAEEIARGLQRLESNELDALQYSNPMATPGSDIEQLATRRKAMADGVAHLSWVTGWYVPQVHNVRANEQHQRLVSVDVQHTSAFGRWVVLFGQQPLTAEMLGLEAPHTGTMTYDNEEAAWLAAAAYCGDYRW